MQNKVKLLEDLNYQHKLENIDHQKYYKQMLDQQEKIKITKPERAFKPYESPERVSQF